MLKLCGFSSSNYYNKVKFALLEKGVAFEEVLVWGGDDPAVRPKSPLGKIPFIEDGSIVVSESQAIVEYIESAYPGHPLIPGDRGRASKVRELIMFTEFYLEWEARRLYPEAFFGGRVSDDVKQACKRRLERAIGAFGELVRFAPYALGAEFTLADCVLAVHLPAVASATKVIYGRDFTADERIASYLANLASRPTLQKVNADRKANVEMLVARLSAAQPR